MTYSFTNPKDYFLLILSLTISIGFEDDLTHIAATISSNVKN